MFLRFIKLTIVVIFLFSNADTSAKSNEQEASPVELLVFKTPTCGCCKKWVSHLEEQGIVAHTQDFASLAEIKAKVGIKPNYRSCHTAITQSGFAFEGHVPAKFVRKFLAESHPNAIGLSVPAMPVGSPGMEVGDQFVPYRILLLLKDGSSEVYAKIDRYEDQF